MKFHRESTQALTIRRVERGRIRIGDEHYEETVALTGEAVIGNVDAPPIDELAVADLESLLGTEPEILLLGTGWAQRQPQREFVFGMARRGIGLEVMDTPAACRTFNVLVAEGRRTAALLVID
ncbi:MAG: MTH938/NDUFAF3 family protein [Woeseiaceae bacterium]|nr:MTH938/NDUFAF3 family protein [Woeseiaceae bacterium]